jgi:intracellular sulfur oxidation DsrE/DsrF family protein
MDRSGIGDPVARRSFLARLSAGAAACAAAIGVAPLITASADASAHASARALSEPWQPARHADDDWFDQPGAKHRFFFDTSHPEGFAQALGWARNFLEASVSGYGLTDADNAVIICARHRSTAFAFNDAMWAKYGAALSERSNNFVDPKTKQVPVINYYLVNGSGEGPRNSGLEQLLKRGVRLAVCGMATRRTATTIATAGATAGAQKAGDDKAKVDDIYKELTANLVPNAHIVPAGIVAVNRAQERGYTLATVA